MAEPFTPEDVRRHGAVLHDAAHGGNEGVGCYEQMCRQFDRYAEVLLAALAQDGRLLPSGTETRVEYGSRAVLNGEVLYETAAPLAVARRQAEGSREQQQRNPDATGVYVVVQRTKYLSPWQEYPEP